MSCFVNNLKVALAQLIAKDQHIVLKYVASEAGR